MLSLQLVEFWYYALGSEQTFLSGRHHHSIRYLIKGEILIEIFLTLCKHASYVSIYLSIYKLETVR